jgi:geranylgeranyl diphosphate synthase, type II
MTEDKIEDHELQQYFEKYRPQIENALREHLPCPPPDIEKQFAEAAEFALSSDKKRLHAVLTLLGAELFGGKTEIFLPAAAAIEFIRTSFLIFGDLFFFNKEPQRSGKSLFHEKFDKSLALNAAIGFLNASYELVFVNHNGLPERAMKAHAEIVECIGAGGRVGERVIDADLMRLAMRTGAILAGANYLELAQISRFAELLGGASEPFDNSKTEDARRILIENFPSSEARTCLIQLTDYIAEGND